MATLKFYQIKEANAEIARLGAELESISAAALASKERDDKNAATIAELEKANGELSAAKIVIENLGNDLKAANVANETLTARISELEKNGKTAGAIAAEIVSAQGVPTVPAGAAANPISGQVETVESVRRKLATETDTQKKSELATKLREMRGHGGIFQTK